MSPLLALLLGAVLSPHILSLSEGTIEPETVTPNDPPNIPDVRSLANSNTNFAFSLYKLLAAQKPKNNVIFSPFSISVALALLTLGARGNTQTETLQGLKFNLTQLSDADIHQGFQLLLKRLRRPGPQLRIYINTAVFVDQQLHLLKSFQQEAKTLYTVDALPTKFQDPLAAENFINNYVEQKTQGKIHEVVMDLESGTKIMLVNCLFFKGKWKTPFDPHQTFMGDFHVNESRVENVPMMMVADVNLLHFRDEMLGSTVVQLPYRDDRVYAHDRSYALLILPDQGRMTELEGALHPCTFQRWRDSMRTRQITLYLPKFSISGDYDLDKVLPMLGIREIFSKNADLSGFIREKNLPVSQVVHKAVLDVTEEGTEATDATGISMMTKSLIRNSGIVNFNRPFLMAVFSEDTEDILFLGRVANPQTA